ncbi:MAG TPA: hypothetical protein VFZ59_07015 [Verrucomicrobiae bacterium]|nr:hypothetical protein [Verrucomicrobiae bacterium]
MNNSVLNPLRKSQSTFAAGLVAVATLLLAVTSARALIPEPDSILYGTITLDSVPITAAMTNVVVEARRTANGPAIATYRMGDNASLGNFYSLRIPMESVLPIESQNAAKTGDALQIVLRDTSGIRGQTNLTLVERGYVQRMDFGLAVPDSDGDGIPDAWELHRFGQLGMSATNLTSNGQTVFQHFIAGTDPNATNGGFRIFIAATNSQKRVWFVAQRAEGSGYEGLARKYTLEFRPSLAAGSWSDVPSYVDILGTNQTVNFFPAGANASGFYRARVSLIPASVLNERPTLKIESTAPGLATLSWTSAGPGWLLQETTNVTSPNWINSPSGATNPITVPAGGPAKYYRLFKP